MRDPPKNCHLPAALSVDCLVMNLPLFRTCHHHCVIAGRKVKQSQEIDRFLVYFDNESAFHPISVTAQR